MLLIVLRGVVYIASVVTQFWTNPAWLMVLGTMSRIRLSRMRSKILIGWNNNRIGWLLEHSAGQLFFVLERWCFLASKLVFYPREYCDWRTHWATVFGPNPFFSRPLRCRQVLLLFLISFECSLNFCGADMRNCSKYRQWLWKRRNSSVKIISKYSSRLFVCSCHLSSRSV